MAHYCDERDQKMNERDQKMNYEKAQAYVGETQDRDYPGPRCEAMDKAVAILEETVANLERSLAVVLRPSVPAPTALRDEPVRGDTRSPVVLRDEPVRGDTRSPVVLRLEGIEERVNHLSGKVQNLNDRIDLP